MSDEIFDAEAPQDEDWEARKEELKNKRHKRQKQRRRRKVFIGSSCALMVVGVCIAIYAKYIAEYGGVSPVPLGMTADFYMDVVCEKDEHYVQLEQEIDLEEINPGETKEFTFIVRNGTFDGDDTNVKISDVDIDYTIQIIHTRNLPLVYELYEWVGDGNGELIPDGSGNRSNYKLLQKNDANGYSIYYGDDNSTDNYNNVGVYERYTKGYFNKNGEYIGDGSSDTMAEFFLKRDRRYNMTKDDITIRKYLLKIDWPTIGNSEYNQYVSYSNEVDLVYVVVKGTQTA